MSIHWFDVSFNESKHAEYLGMKWFASYRARKIDSSHENYELVKSLFNEISVDEARSRAKLKKKDFHLVERFENFRNKISKRSKSNPYILGMDKVKIFLCAYTKKTREKALARGAYIDLTGKVYIWSNWKLQRFLEWLPADFFLKAVDRIHEIKRKERETYLYDLSINLFGTNNTQDQLDIKLANYFAKKRFIV